MKVMFVALGVYAGVGGLERFNQRVVTALAEFGRTRGLRSWVIALWDTSKDALAAPDPVRFTPGGRNKPRTASCFVRLLRQVRPDVVLYGHVLLAPLACLARALSPASRQVLFVHGREVWLEPFRDHVPRLERLAVRWGIDRVAAVSRLTAERMQRAYALPGGRFTFLPNAVDAPERAPQLRNGAGGGQRLLTVTRLSRKDHYKGCDRVIRALPQVLEKFPGARYEVVGEGPLRGELEDLARRLGVGHAVGFHGYLDEEELERVYSRSHILVMPSTGEGFGIVYLEAWRHGVPVVAGNRDAGAEVVTDGVDGLCVDPYSVEQVARALISLLSDPERAAAMGRRGYQTLMAKYTHGHFRENLEHILGAI